MHLDKFDLNLLVALDALLTEKHVTRAAEKLCVSQPAMSGALARLRLYFDDKLLERVGTNLELTPRAVDLVAEVRELLIRIRTTLRSAPTFDPAGDPHDFRMIMSDYVVSVFMPAVTRQMRQAAPEVRYRVEHLNNDSLSDVDRGLADFCITILGREPDEELEPGDLRRELLFTDDFVLVMDRASCVGQTDISLLEFLRLPYVEVRFTHTVFSVVEAAIRRQQLPLKAAVVTPSFTAAACMIPGTPMTAIIPRRLAKLLAPSLGLALFDAPMDLPQIQETLVWHRRGDADPAHLWFRNFLGRVAADFRQNNMLQ